MLNRADDEAAIERAAALLREGRLVAFPTETVYGLGADARGTRWPLQDPARRLLRAVGRPVAAPSANRSGRISPTSAEHVREELGDRVAMILDGGPCQVGVESTVLDLTTG